MASLLLVVYSLNFLATVSEYNNSLRPLISAVCFFYTDGIILSKYCVIIIIMMIMMMIIIN